MKHGWTRRLGPLLLVGLVVFGAFLWRGGLGLLPVERELLWQVPGDFASVRRLELQLYQGASLLKREELAAPGGLTFAPTTRVVLARGTYQGRILVWRQGSGEPEPHAARVLVGEAMVIEVKTDPR